MWNSQKAFFLDWLIFIFDSRLGLIFIRYHKYASKIKFIYAFLVATFTCSICLVQDSSEHVAYQFQPHFATIIVVCPRHGMSHLALAGLVMKILQAQAWANIPKYYSQADTPFRTLSKNVYDWKILERNRTSFTLWLITGWNRSLDYVGSYTVLNLRNN